MNPEPKEQGTTIIKETPFSVTFTWKEESFEITLIDGQDLFKIVNLISYNLKKNGIDHKIEETTKK